MLYGKFSMLSAILITMSLLFIHPIIVEAEITDQKTLKITGLVSEDLMINGNNDLINQSLNRGWAGDGTKNNPIKISGLIFNQSNLAINVSNTDLYLEISNCYFMDSIWKENDPSYNLLLSNTSNCLVIDNTFNREQYGDKTYGIFLEDSSDIRVYNNTVSKIHYGIYSDNSSEITIDDNNVHDCTIGITCSYSTKMNVSANKLSKNQYNLVILLVDQSLISQNTIIDGSYGIYFTRVSTGNPSTGLQISHNFIKDNEKGVMLNNVENSNISYNKIHSNKEYAIMFGAECLNIRVFGNELLFNGQKAIQNNPNPGFSNKYLIYDNIIFPEQFFDFLTIIAVLIVLAVIAYFIIKNRERLL